MSIDPFRLAKKHVPVLRYYDPYKLLVQISAMKPVCRLLCCSRVCLNLS